MKKLLTLCITILPSLLMAQQKETLINDKTPAWQTKDVRLVTGGGLSKHGTGDLGGYSFFNQVDIQLNKNFFLSPGIQFTNHSSRYIFTNTIQLNYVTAGVNIFTNINYVVLNKPRHHISIGAGPLIRFQNSSVPEHSDLSLASSGEQIFSLKYDKVHSTSAGYNISPAYYYQCSKTILAGAKIIFQNDTEGDVINSSVLFVGIKL